MNGRHHQIPAHKRERGGVAGVAPHDDQVDPLCQALTYLRASTFDSASFQQMANAHQEMVAAQRRGVPAFGTIVMNARDLEDYEDGPSVDGVRSQIRAGFRG